MNDLPQDDLELPIKKLVDVATLPASGENLRIEADDRQRAELADLFSLVALNALTAAIEVKPYRNVGASVRGEVVAEIVQTCVVTLEETTQEIAEPIDLKLMPAAEQDDKISNLKEIDIDPEGVDPPDEFTDGRIDVGAIVVEHFALAIDPYPRKPGVEFNDDGDVEAQSGGGVKPSPFAVLGQLKSGEGS